MLSLLAPPVGEGSLPKPVYTAVASALESVASPVAEAVRVELATVLVVDMFTRFGS